MKLSKYKSGKGGVVYQEVLKGDWVGCCFVWRCPKNSYYPVIPTVLNIPFNDECCAKQYAMTMFNNGYGVNLRRAKRTSGLYEVQVYFPMGFTINQAIDSLYNQAPCNLGVSL